LFQKYPDAWGVTVSIQKTKGMAIGGGSEDNEAMAPINLGSGEIKMVDSFTYVPWQQPGKEQSTGTRD
jgi:hypothetical protein